jgi:hypothetical protein
VREELRRVRGNGHRDLLSPNSHPQVCMLFFVLRDSLARGGQGPGGNPAWLPVEVRSERRSRRLHPRPSLQRVWIAGPWAGVDACGAPRACTAVCPAACVQEVASQAQASRTPVAPPLPHRHHHNHMWPASCIYCRCVSRCAVSAGAGVTPCGRRRDGEGAGQPEHAVRAGQRRSARMQLRLATRLGPRNGACSEWCAHVLMDVWGLGWEGGVGCGGRLGGGRSGQHPAPWLFAVGEVTQAHIALPADLRG